MKILTPVLLITLLIAFNSGFSQRVEIISKGKTYSTINKGKCLADVVPADILSLAGKNEWEKHGYYPADGQIGEVVQEIPLSQMNCTPTYDIVLIKVQDKYYVPIGKPGIRYLNSVSTNNNSYTPPVTSSVNKPPTIQITEPDISRGFRNVQNKSIRVVGVATDSDGIYEVTINGLEAALGSDGYFSLDVPLAIGDNTVNVVATDTKLKSSNRTFRVSRESGSSTVVSTYTPDEKRVALIVGNSNYKGAASLGVNPINDARDMSTALKSLGFDVVLRTDANQDTMTDAIRAFGRMSRDADIALFYFAGHGMQVDKTNYLLPLGVDITSKNDVDFECIDVNSVQRVMEVNNPNRLNLMILDACRNNPFRSWSRGGDTGLAEMKVPSGTLIAYSTSPGSVASNGGSRNGLYTGELVKQLKIPQRLEDVFINTRNEVERKSGGAQSPWEEARLKGAYYLKK